MTHPVDEPITETVEEVDLKKRHAGAVAGLVLGGGWGALAGYFVGRNLE